jgi:hypothetical protein
MLGAEKEKVAIVRRTVCTCRVSSEERKRESASDNECCFFNLAKDGFTGRETVLVKRVDNFFRNC